MVTNKYTAKMALVSLLLSFFFLLYARIRRYGREKLVVWKNDWIEKRALGRFRIARVKKKKKKRQEKKKREKSKEECGLIH